MGWPDISRRVWLYVIGKLGIFTNVDISQLELSATKLRLSELEVDSLKLEVPGMTTDRFTIAQVELELGVSGLYLSAKSVYIELSVDSLESPDLAISRLMEATKEDIKAGVEGVAAEDGSSGIGAVASKIADLALSQINASVTDINIDITLGMNSRISLHIGQALLSSRHTVELENIMVKFYGENYMLQSVYFETTASFPSLPDLAFINSICIDFSLDKMDFNVQIDNAKVGCLPLLRLVALLLGDTCPHQGTPESRRNSENNNTSKVKTTLGINVVQVFENLEGSGQPLELRNLTLAEDKFTIDELELKEVVHIAPFLTVSKNGNDFKAKVEVPISVDIPLSLLSSVKSLLESVILILNELELEETETPTKFSLDLLEVRIAIAGGLAVLIVFPQSVCEIGISIRECVMIAADGQIAVENINFDFANLKLEIDEIKAMLTSKFAETLSQLEGAYSANTILDTNSENSKDELEFKGYELPSLEVNVGKLRAQHVVSGLDILLSLQLELNGTRSWVKLEGSLGNAWMLTQFTLHARSNDCLQTIDSVFLLQKSKVYLDKYTPGAAGGTEPTASITASDRSIMPRVFCTVKFMESILTVVGDQQIAISVSEAMLNVERNGAVHFKTPQIGVSLAFPSRHATILRAKHISYRKHGPHQRLSIGKCVLSTCGDSANFVFTVIGKFVPEQTAPVYKLEPEDLVDTFKDVDMLYFRKPHVNDNTPTNSPPADQTTEPNILCFEFVLKHFQWHIFDGHDLNGEIDMMDSMFLPPSAGKASSKSSTTSTKLRSDIPYLVISLKHLCVQVYSQLLVVECAYGSVNDEVPTSEVSVMVEQHESNGFLFRYVQKECGTPQTPEPRVEVNLSSMTLKLDQDTVELIAAFLQEATPPSPQENPNQIETFIRQFVFSGCQLVIDYYPKQVDYRSLRSGSAGELLNVFVVKGAHLKLPPVKLSCIVGWHQLTLDLVNAWLPSILSTHQLGGLLAGLTPVRRALRYAEYAHVALQSLLKKL